MKKWLTEDVCCYAIVAREVGDATHTPHLQGFMHLKRKVRFTVLKKKLNAHYEIARGNDEENRDYCKKGGDVILEVGKPAEKVGTTNIYVCAKELADKVAAGEDLDTLLSSDERYVAAYAKYTGFVDKCVEAKCEKIGKEKFEKKYCSMNLVLHEWQVELYDMLTKEEPDDRKIYWYIDLRGGAGKSTFVNYYMARHKAACFCGGKIENLAFAYNREPVCLFLI